MKLNPLGTWQMLVPCAEFRVMMAQRWMRYDPFQELIISENIIYRVGLSISNGQAASMAELYHPQGKIGFSRERFHHLDIK